MIYFNDNNRHAVNSLFRLMYTRQLPPGFIDDRSILSISPADVSGLPQAHFFAGIGGWAEAFRLAGLPVDFPVWSGSCPCQPFSIGGLHKGTDDERHLFPALFNLIDGGRPSLFFGEQVATPDGLKWLADVHASFNSIGYVVGAAVLRASYIGAPHKRERIFFGAVAYSDVQRLSGWWRAIRSQQRSSGQAAACGFSDHWSQPKWIDGVDARRPVGSGVEFLADGVPAKMGRFETVGNAIVPQLGASFIVDYLDSLLV